MSDIARAYAPGKEPVLVAGTAASNAAGAGTPEISGKEKASLVNQHKAVVTDIDR